jgi:excisionase family DNA binding protein
MTVIAPVVVTQRNGIGIVTSEDKVTLLTAKQVCEWLGISSDTLNKWFAMGLKGYRVGKVIRIPENELWTFLEEHRAQPDKA